MVAQRPEAGSQRYSTYSNGKPYEPARGRYAPRACVEDQFRLSAPVVEGRPTPSEFLRKIVRELKIRFYQAKTIKNYLPSDKSTAGNYRQASRRHLSVRTTERTMERAVRIAGIKKKATPHSLRHSFACHTYEYTCDLRKIQQILGHVHLETTTIYVRVAKATDGQAVISPLDVMTRKQAARTQVTQRRVPSVGKLRIHLKPEASERLGFCKAKVTLSIETDGKPVYLTGIIANEVRRGWVNLKIPPLEQWEEPLRWLSRRQRERIEEPGFYELLQREIPRRLLQLTPE